MSSPFGDLFGNDFGSFPKKEPAEKGVQIRGRSIDGAYYVRADDVVALLEANRLLPKITAQLKAAINR